MSKKKLKREKSYRRKPCVLPLGMRADVETEMPGYQGSMALGSAYFCEQHVYDLLANADLTRRIAPEGDPILPLAADMVQACAAIQQRAARTGKLGVTGDELRVLREGIGRTMDYLRTVSAYRIQQAALAANAEFERLGALRV